MLAQTSSILRNIQSLSHYPPYDQTLLPALALPDPLLWHDTPYSASQILLCLVPHRHRRPMPPRSHPHSCPTSGAPLDRPWKASRSSAALDTAAEAYPRSLLPG